MPLPVRDLLISDNIPPTQSDRSQSHPQFSRFPVRHGYHRARFCCEFSVFPFCFDLVRLLRTACSSELKFHLLLMIGQTVVGTLDSFCFVFDAVGLGLAGL